MQAADQSVEHQLQTQSVQERTWGEVQERVQHHATMAAQKVKLDIGGRVFSTTRSLLLSFDESFFHAMLRSGRWPPRRDGTYFVDRSPAYFEPMLHYMRIGQLSVARWTSVEMDRLREEFDFYQVALPASMGVHACEGRRVRTWGSKGGLAGQLEYPAGLAVSGDNEVFVADSDNHRIQVFDMDGAFLRMWGSMGNGDGDLHNPEHIAVSHTGEVFVVDCFNHRVQVFSSVGTFLRKWGSFGAGHGQFQFPRGIAVTDNGEVVVADTRNHRIQVFTTAGVFLRTWGSAATLGDPHGIAASNSGEIFVTDYDAHRVRVFQPDGTLVRSWGSRGAAPGQFISPRGIAVSALGEVFVGDGDNARIQVFGENGTFRRQFAAPSGNLNVAVAPNGDVLVSAKESYSVTLYQ